MKAPFMSPNKRKSSTLDPHLVRSVTGKGAEPKAIPNADMKPLTVKLPPYVLEQLRIKAATNKTTARYEVLRGLKRLGYTVNEADLVGDKRRTNKTAK